MLPNLALIVVLALGGCAKSIEESGRDALDYISKNQWTVWGSTCHGKPHYLTTTYSMVDGQILFKDGVAFQNMNPRTKENAKFSIEFNLKDGFTYSQTLYIKKDMELLRALTENKDVVAAEIKEEITLIDKQKIKVKSEERTINTQRFLSGEGQSYGKKFSERIETICN